jgi:histidyl-tRNA synthetase
MAKTAITRPSYLLKEFDKPLYLASHFGFIPIEAPRVTDKDRDIVEDCLEDETGKGGVCLYRPTEKAALLRTYVEKNFAELPHPLLLSYKKNETSKKKPDYFLHIIGNPTPLSEAMLIRTSISILSDEGHKNLVVNINSIGDKDSVAAYERELHHFAKKVLNTLTEEMRDLIKKDIFAIVRQNQNECVQVREELPPSIASLTSASRAHFKEVLEHLEALGVEFRVMPDLVGNRHYSSHTVFTICDASIENAPPLASGYRYSRLSKRFGFRKELQCTCATIFGDLKKDNGSKRMYKDLPKPKFYLVQLGPSAKMKCINLIEMLRQNHIPVYHYFGRDKITAQLSTAENLRVPYLLIIGQKEALESTVTVRNMNTRAQITIKMADLPYYLKNINL